MRHAKRLNRKGRLTGARQWIADYPGKNFVRGYMKHFGVDRLCAMIELKMSGYGVSQEEIQEQRAVLIARQQRREEQNALAEPNESEPEGYEEEDERPYDCNDYYHHLSECTCDGFAYGISWEEWVTFGLDELTEEASDQELDPFAED